MGIRTKQIRHLRRAHIVPRPLLAAALATIVSFVPALPAQAAVTYPAAQYLSGEGQNADLPQVAIDSHDRATVVWRTWDGSNYRVQAVRIGAGGTPGTVRTLSAVGQNADLPQVAIDSHDRATVVWERSDGSNYRVQAVRLAADGTPGTVQTLSTAGMDADESQVAIDSHDRATVVWERSDGSNYRVQSVRIGAGGTPGTVRTLSAVGQNADLPQVAIDSHDRATVVWERSDGSNVRVQAVRLAADGTPGTVRTLSAAGGHAFDPEVAIDTHDRATVVWWRWDGSNYRVQSVRLGADGTPGPVQTLSTAGRHAFEPQVAVDSAGRATVVWHRRVETGADRVQSVRLGAGGTPGPVRTLSAAGGNADVHQVEIDSHDRATVVWQSDGGSYYSVQSVRLGADGTPGPVQTLSTAGPVGENLPPYPQVAVDSVDRARVVWGGYDESTYTYRVQSARAKIVAPAAPALTATTPASPANGTGPRVRGSTDAGSTVRLYTSPGCSGLPAATGPAAAFASPGLQASVPANSATTFHATATDSDGTSACSTGSITYIEDSTAPTGAKLATALPAFSLTTPLRVAWGGAADNLSGVKGYSAYSLRAPYNGPFGQPAPFKTTAGAAGGNGRFAAVPAHTYCFYVTATDNAANTSAPSPQRCTAFPVDDRSLSGSSWTRKTGRPGYYRGTYSRSSTKGARLTLAGARARRLALVATTGPGYGSVAVRQAGKLLKKVSLASKTKRKERRIRIATFASVHTGAVTIRVASSAKPVRIDGLGVGR